MKQALVKSKSQSVLGKDKTYVIAGGLGGQGRSSAQWLVSKGARHLVLLSRSGASSPAAVKFVDDMTNLGVHIYAPACDITDRSRLQSIINECKYTMPPIKGCIQSSMVIRVSFSKSNTCRYLMTWHRMSHSRKCRCANGTRLCFQKSPDHGIYTLSYPQTWTSSSSFRP
jgi:shikimate 5-dehydrogenase